MQGEKVGGVEGRKVWKVWKVGGWKVWWCGAAVASVASMLRRRCVVCTHGIPTSKFRLYIVNLDLGLLN